MTHSGSAPEMQLIYIGRMGHFTGAHWETEIKKILIKNIGVVSILTNYFHYGCIKHACDPVQEKDTPGGG